MPNLLIVDDARDVAEVIAFGARMNWPTAEVTLASNGEEALEKFERGVFDLVVLDVAMPPPDGFEVCRRIRAHSTVPILMLTVRDSVQDKVRALDLGADDYLTKPFDHLELLARLRALMRRSNDMSGSIPSTLTLGELTIDLAAHQAWLRGQELALTSTEYRLLEELIRHAGKVLSHRHLLEQVWGPEYTGEIHYLKVFIRRLRQKLGDDADHPHFIQTEWGIGYSFLSPSP